MRNLNTFKAYDVPDVNTKNTGKILKKLRQINQLTIRELQDFFGFDYPNAIYDWEKGLKLPNISNLIALSTLYEVSIDKILLSNEQDFSFLTHQISFHPMSSISRLYSQTQDSYW